MKIENIAYRLAGLTSNLSSLSLIIFCEECNENDLMNGMVFAEPVIILNMKHLKILTLIKPQSIMFGKAHYCLKKSQTIRY
mgnify:CR=1 FL=1